MWIVLLVLIIGMIGTVIFAGAVRHNTKWNGEIHPKNRLGNIAPAVETIAAFPQNIFDLLMANSITMVDTQQLLAKEKRFEGQAHFQFNYPAGSRPELGYVLINRYDGDLVHSVSELWDLNAQELVHTWSFSEVDSLWKKLKFTSDLVNVPIDHAARRFRSGHAFLSKNGELITHSFGAPLIRADVCSNLELLNDSTIFHHSIERDHSGNFWIPILIEPRTVDLGTSKFRDDGIALVDAEGDILFKKSVTQLLDENGFTHLIYGKGKPNNDPIHLNDIQPVLTDGIYWKQGDVFLSLRNQSMVVLYRPSTNEVLWLKQGPWIHQHDVNILSGHEISIFNNNAPAKYMDTTVVRGVSNILVYNFKDDYTHSPFQANFETLELRTMTEGRGRIFGTEVFVEETNSGRLIQFKADGSVSWQFINSSEKGDIYKLNWSRLITGHLGDQIRKIIFKKGCI